MLKMYSKHSCVQQQTSLIGMLKSSQYTVQQWYLNGIYFIIYVLCKKGSVSFGIVSEHQQIKQTVFFKL